MDQGSTSFSARDELATLARIPDVRQRGHALVCRLSDMSDEELVDALGTIVNGALVGHVDSVVLYNSLLDTHLWVQELGVERLSRLVALAHENLEFDVVTLLVDFAREGDLEIPFQPFLDGALKETPLGVRKSLARRPDFDMLKRIARDQDHRVIGILLFNPRLTERDVTLIASTRPTSPKVLEEIYRHPKWVSRYSVKKIIVLNPYTPLSISLKLMLFLRNQDLDEVMRAPDLHGTVKDQARRLVRKRDHLRSSGSGV
ncbi:MAG: hypothetical protein AB1646_01510 [Thermodesulfobacteriota bacterium]